MRHRQTTYFTIYHPDLNKFRFMDSYKCIASSRRFSPCCAGKWNQVSYLVKLNKLCKIWERKRNVLCCQFSTGTTWEFNRFVPERARNFTFSGEIYSFLWVSTGIYIAEILPAQKLSKIVARGRSCKLLSSVAWTLLHPGDWVSNK